jgi:AcrR family transcriptional regulator
MTTTANSPAVLIQRPKRADAQRNYNKLLAAAREAFTEADAAASLEDIARRAGVGIGTLYRHFPTRQNLIEAVYVDEVEALSRTAYELADHPPWDALVGWLHRFVEYVGTKQALVQELFAEGNHSSDVFANCRTTLYSAGAPLLERAQEAGEVRRDVDINDVLHLVAGIAKMTSADPGQVGRVLGIALDGLRQGSVRAATAKRAGVSP